MIFEGINPLADKSENGIDGSIADGAPTVSTINGIKTDTLIETDEDSVISIDVLANDTDEDSSL